MSPGEGYTSTAKLLHWVMAATWIFAWCVGILATHWRDELNSHHGLTILHKSVGSILLLLIVLRVAWRMTHPAPPLPDTMNRVSKLAAHLGHVALYAIALIALPLSGWYWSSVADKPIMLAGLFKLPPLVEPADHLYALAKSIHNYTAWLCGSLVGGHIAVALKHHFMEKDDILIRILPSFKKGGR